MVLGKALEQGVVSLTQFRVVKKITLRVGTEWEGTEGVKGEITVKFLSRFLVGRGRREERGCLVKSFYFLPGKWREAT